jgi:hypothetical protein
MKSRTRPKNEEVGLTSKWKTEKQFSSFLGLFPDSSIGEGKVLRRSTRKVYNRAADALRLCAQSLTHSNWAPNPPLESQTRGSGSKLALIDD